jgi:glycine cleavage system H protein
MTEVGRTEIRDKILETFFHQLQQFSLRDDRYYFAPHTWVQKLNEDSAVVGIDDFAARMLPPPTSIVFPSVNAPIQQGEYCAWLVSSEGTIAFISPATGVIHAVNDELYRAPGLLLTSPYDKGWLVRVGLEKFETDMRNLLPRISASGRCRKDIERLRRQFLVHSKPDSAALGKTLLDGGRYVENVQVLLGLRRYIEIISQILSS